MSAPLSAGFSVFAAQKQPPIIADKKPALSEMIQEITKQLGIEFKALHDGQVIRLKKGEAVKFIHGYFFPVNISSSDAICRDRAATSDLLKRAQIPQIRHKLYLNPKLGEWNPKNGTWPLVHDYGKKHAYRLVVKAKEGDGGVSLYRTNNPTELEQAVSTLFRSDKDVVISPFKPIRHLYQVVVFGQNVELIFQRSLPSLTGDGEQSVRQLFIAFLEKLQPEEQGKMVKEILPEILFSNKIPSLVEEINLNWKHNGVGAKNEQISLANLNDPLIAN